jgi:hypothetical protein
MKEQERKISKVVFNEADGKSKAVFGYLEDLGDFVQVTTTRGNIFKINKSAIVFIKEGGY